MILHPLTKAALDDAALNPPHALLIAGEEGGGKPSLALSLSGEILHKDALAADSSFRHFKPEKGSLGIDQIRSIHKFLHLRTTGAGVIRRAIIIEDAHLMTVEAQNALLKVLEEPPADTVIIMTAVPSKDLLPTIYSRLQQITVKSPSLGHATEYFNKKGFKSADVDKAYALSNGQMGLMSALLDPSADHELVRAIKTAKTLLAKSKFERLAMVDELAKQKTGVPDLLKALKRITRSALMQSASRGNGSATRNWHAILMAVQEAESQLVYNPNTKLLLTSLMLKI